MERWQQIESLFQEALQRDPAERDAWLREACRGDSGLHREVASLLANHHEATDFAPWAAVAAAQLIGGPVSLHAGQRLGPYEIVALIGAGGMGEVYKARDTRLKRDVAIKICAAQFSERFEREARVIASLNHPNICQLYDVGPNFLVMELVEGENLAGPLPLETALHYARQIADALEAAHAKLIVHRDLKPLNVKITPAGVVKVLDFGLAKAAEEPAAADPANSPTLTMSPTRAGMILGTAPYMSPEQARGAQVDKRADIWAFGVVLYEMLTGKQAFHGETTADILAAVLKEEPDWSRIPGKVQPLLRRCMVKDRKQRLRDIGDAMLLLEGVPELTAERRPWGWIMAAAALAIALAITAGFAWWRSGRAASFDPLVLSAELSPDTTIDRFRGGCQVGFSPDGKRIAVIERYAAGKYRLATRRLDQNQFVPLSGTEGANMPFFSPDGQSIGFFADGKLKKIAVQGGSPVTLCDAPGARGASWGDDGNIIAAFNGGLTGLMRVPSGGGTPTAATQLSKEKGDTAHAWPQVLTGSQAVLFSAYSGGAYYEPATEILVFKTGERRTIHREGLFGRYLPTSHGAGHLVYIHQGTLFAAPFDLRQSAVTGAPQPMLEDVSLSGTAGGWNFDFSQTGTFVYASWRGFYPQSMSIFWLDHAGKTRPLQMSPGFYRSIRFSPDGKRLAFELAPSPLGGDIWVKDLESGVTSRLTALPGLNMWPVWTPDGSNIIFESRHPAAGGPAAPGLYWIRADGSGEAHRLTDGKATLHPQSFSPDGKRLVYTREAGDLPGEIWTAPVEGDPDHPRLGNPELFLRAPVYLAQATFSPDGRWLAYTSSETGRNEVYVRPFPRPESARVGRVQVSSAGGRFPIWSRGALGGGRELFFLDLDGRIMVADYTTNGDSFTAAKPQVWSEKTVAHTLGLYPYDLAADGKHFAVVLYPGETAEPQQKPTDSVTVLLNFFDELRRRVPAGSK